MQMHRQTLEAVGKQLQAMGSAEYEIAAHDYKAGKVDAKGRASGVMHIRPASGPNIPPATKGLTDAEVLTSLKWLAFKNSQGCHIFIRPFGETKLTFIDDLSKATVTKMTTEGYQFAALIESSPGNFHGWLKNNESLTGDEQTTAARILCERFGGDANSAAKRHFGRLAGFTNQKEKYFDETIRNGQGGYPFVKFHGDTIRGKDAGRTFDKADEFLGEVKQRMIDGQEQVQVKAKQHEAYKQTPYVHQSRIKDIEYFQQKFSSTGERHKSDFNYALHALSNGVSESEVRHTIATKSNSTSNRGGPKRSQSYVDRTISGAYKFMPRQSHNQSQQLGR
jgi:hypothetical protein